MLDYVAALLKDPNPVTRGTAATAIGRFGREAARYRNALQDALREEKTPEVRGMIKGALTSTE
jgi:hypothetical protein